MARQHHQGDAWAAEPGDEERDAVDVVDEREVLGRHEVRNGVEDRVLIAAHRRDVDER